MSFGLSSHSLPVFPSLFYGLYDFPQSRSLFKSRKTVQKTAENVTVKFALNSDTRQVTEPTFTKVDGQDGKKGHEHNHGHKPEIVHVQEYEHKPVHESVVHIHEHKPHKPESVVHVHEHHESKPHHKPHHKPIHENVVHVHEYHEQVHEPVYYEPEPVVHIHEHVEAEHHHKPVKKPVKKIKYKKPHKHGHGHMRKKEGSTYVLEYGGRKKIGHKFKGHKFFKKKKYFKKYGIPVIIGVITAKAILLPIILKVLAFFSAKGFLLGLIAVIMASLVSIKKSWHPHAREERETHSGTRVEVVHVPVHDHHHDHHGYHQHHGGHHHPYKSYY